jgi:hypothetical protein
MSFRKEALRMDEELAVTAPGSDRMHSIGGFAPERTARSNDGDAHAQAVSTA